MAKLLLAQMRTGHIDTEEDQPDGLWIAGDALDSAGPDTEIDTREK